MFDIACSPFLSQCLDLQGTGSLQGGRWPASWACTASHASCLWTPGNHAGSRQIQRTPDLRKFFQCLSETAGQEKDQMLQPLVVKVICLDRLLLPPLAWAQHMGE